MSRRDKSLRSAALLRLGPIGVKLALRLAAILKLEQYLGIHDMLVDGTKTSYQPQHLHILNTSVGFAATADSQDSPLRHNLSSSNSLLYQAPPAYHIDSAMGCALAAYHNRNHECCVDQIEARDALGLRRSGLSGVVVLGRHHTCSVLARTGAGKPQWYQQ